MSAPTPVPTPSTSEPTASQPTPQEMLACNQGLKKLMTSYWQGVSSRTSIQSTRLLLKGFGEACAKSLPTLASAAIEASRVGRAERSRILGKASAEYCAKAETLDTAAQLLIDCPSKEASSAMHDKLDAGTYAFARLIVKKGVAADLTYSEELMLQASLNPKLDK